MMNFYYDPILGLQYTYLDDIITINLDYITPNFDKEMWMKYIKQMGISILQTQTEPRAEIIGQITNYML